MRRMMSTPSGTGGVSGNFAGTKLKGCSWTVVPALCKASMPSPSIQMIDYILSHCSGRPTPFPRPYRQATAYSRRNRIAICLGHPVACFGSMLLCMCNSRRVHFAAIQCIHEQQCISTTHDNCVGAPEQSNLHLEEVSDGAENASAMNGN